MKKETAEKPQISFPMPASHGNSLQARYQAKEASARAQVLCTFLHRKNGLHCSSSRFTLNWFQ